MFFVRHSYDDSLMTRSSQRAAVGEARSMDIVASMSVLQHP